ncbi:MAG: hypothetical protein APF76_07765 [Desulfitibacter sp. BRH_c19]|nr:MAG: hypothetical protein APF76_07765 [Desulfitibacter sp. BRH_c19]
MYLEYNVYLLSILLILSLFFDIITKKIPNMLTFPVMLLGLISYTYTGGLTGFWFSFSGLLVGIGIFLIPFILGGMGGGDVKLLGAIGALMGSQFVLIAALYTAIAGGIIALIILLHKGRLFLMIKKGLVKIAKPISNSLALTFKSVWFERMAINLSLADAETQKQEPIKFAYGIAIALGTLIALTDFSQKLFIAGLF